MEETFKSHPFGRTDQFAVAKQLEGLQEKFQVLNRDELALYLRTSLTELGSYRSSWFPEILSLLLHLSDRPALQPRQDRPVRQKPIESEEALSWSELDPSGAAYCGEEEIWQDVDYGAESSEDDLSTVSSEAPAPRVLPQNSIALEEDDDYVIPDELFSSGEDEDLITTVKDVQFWRAENYQAVSRKDTRYSRPITELQIVREAAFMLQGLPTSLFWRNDKSIEVDRRYALAHSSDEALASLLRSFSSIGARIDVLRQFTKIPQSVPYVQSFTRGIEDLLHKFDTFLSNVQAQYLSQTSTVTVSLIQLLEDVRRESRLILSLADLVSSISEDATTPSVRFLDMLFDLACLTQAIGNDEEFQSLAELFFACFEPYMRPIRLWVESGRLDSGDEAFFILEDHRDRDLRALWHDWYTLDEAYRLPNAPKFLHHVARKVFTTGKTMVFLRHLNAIPTEIGCSSTDRAALTFEDIYPSHCSSSLALPFSVQLESAFEKIVDAKHATTSNLLHSVLDQQCGLWMSLQALEYIFLCKDMSVSEIIDHKIFESIDRGRGAWNDRFLLTELAQEAFSSLGSLIDPSRIVVRSAKASNRDPAVRNRSVTMLTSLSFDYILPWPVANIITKPAILTYQRISTFLMQIRRAKYVILKQRLQYRDASGRTPDRRNNALGYALRHNMLWFLNVLYGHITDLVIATSTHTLRKDLSSAKDLDSMIAVHRSYTSSIEDQCFLSKNLLPLHEAIIKLLDLCVRFAGIQAVHDGDNRLDQTTNARNANTGKGGHRHPSEENSSDEDEDEDETKNGDLEQNTTAELLQGVPYPQQLKALKDQFDQLIAVVTAGLKSVGRVDEQPSWEILADRLEWRKKHLDY